MAVVAQSKARKAKIEMASNTDMQLAKDTKASVAKVCELSARYPASAPSPGQRIVWLPVKVSTTMVPHNTQTTMLGCDARYLG